MKTKQEQREQAKQRREELKALSFAFQKIRKEMDLNITINDMIIDYYKKNKGVTELYTFEQWKEKGFSVKKGEKSFLVWSKPIKKEQAQQQEQGKEQEQDKKDFWGVCHLFDSSQVVEIKKNN